MDVQGPPRSPSCLKDQRTGLGKACSPTLRRAVRAGLGVCHLPVRALALTRSAT
jgi:hypothetical protein